MAGAAQPGPAANSSASRTQRSSGWPAKRCSELVQATANKVFGGGFAAGLDVMAVHPHRWRPRKPRLLGGGLVDNQGAVQVRVDAELGPDPLH
jgi:hypothetical protein